MSVGLVALFALLLLAMLSIAVFAAVIAAIRHGRWGVLLVLGGVVAIPMLFILLMVGYANVSDERKSSADVASISTLTSEARRHVQHTIQATDKEFATTNRYIEVISDKPSIQLDAEGSADKDAASADNTTEESQPEAEAAGANTDLPDWIDARAKLHDKVFAAGPFVTPAQCEEDIRRQILTWLAEKAGVSPPAEILPVVEATLDDVVRRTHLSKRETSVGTVYLQYTRAHSDAEIVETIRQEVQNLTAVANRQRGRNRLVLGGGLLLGVVGLLHGFLRAGGRRAETR